MIEPHPPQPKLMLPVGTQVVTLVEVRSSSGELRQPRGAVGVIVKSPVDGSHSYRVRFLDGSEAALARDERSVRKEFQRTGIGGSGLALEEEGLRDQVIYRCVVGSRAYGLEHEASDIDRRGIYLPPAELEWSLYGVP